jgi:hypothetical protein
MSPGLLEDGEVGGVALLRLVADLLLEVRAAGVVDRDVIRRFPGRPRLLEQRRIRSNERSLDLHDAIGSADMPGRDHGPTGGARAQGDTGDRKRCQRQHKTADSRGTH